MSSTPIIDSQVTKHALATRRTLTRSWPKNLRISRMNKNEESKELRDHSQSPA